MRSNRITGIRALLREPSVNSDFRGGVVFS